MKFKTYNFSANENEITGFFHFKNKIEILK